MSRNGPILIFRVFNHAAFLSLFFGLPWVAHGALPVPETIDFNRDVRRVLSENCIRCHGPDEQDRKGGDGGEAGLRLDTREGALAQTDGYAAIIPGQPENSELYKRILTEDENDVMPPADSGKTLSARDKAVLKAWIEQGANYAQHWSYVPPVRPALPPVHVATWPTNAVDRFILNRLEREKLSPSAEADRVILARRVALDLTGLPPTPEEVKNFETDAAPGAYERLVDRLLAKPAFGEHWSRLWLDQARYADSAGYVDDPARTIWAYRDYLVRSFNANKPFDQFTLEQLAGDLLPHPTEDQLIATAFHRNTPTNNEGGTIDEEFRTVAVVDRVNTTMTVWMGSTMACAQCHTHKYDPFTQTDYFRLYAIYNNTADEDRTDEAPVLPLFTDEKKKARAPFDAEIKTLETTMRTRTPALLDAQPAWEARFSAPIAWQPLSSATMTAKSGAALQRDADGIVRVAARAENDSYTFATTSDTAQTLTGFRLETFPLETSALTGPVSNAGEFVVTRVLASITPAGQQEVAGRYVRVELPGQDRVLALAEVQVFGNGDNLAPTATSSQSSTAGDSVAKFANDGRTNGNAEKAPVTSLTEKTDNPWWELDLKATAPVERIVVWKRTDGSFGAELAGARVTLLDEKRAVVWSATLATAPAASAEFAVSGVQPIRLAFVQADVTEDGFAADSILSPSRGRERGWAVGAQSNKAHALVVLPETPVVLPAGARLTVTIEQNSKKKNHTLGKFRLTTSVDDRASTLIRMPEPVLAALKLPAAQRSEAEHERVTAHYLTVAPAFETERQRLAAVTKLRDKIEPYTTVPIMHEVAADKTRKTHLQRRGNYLDLDAEVTPGVPAALHPLPSGVSADRLGLARWIMDEKNPLTSRVISNLLWESVFGMGLVRTSEDFGSQGDPPSHPELLDWLAVDFRESGWDVKRLLRLMVTSATYRQSSRITPDALERDADNRLFARGPRFRLSAEMIRDQSLAVSGLLSAKMYGPPVNPPKPKLGLAAGFGSTLDWEDSVGEDRFRRGLYTSWRRSNPYPSMAAFDAPSREVCTVRRERSNTPLQALVTLNDPVYIEAAQKLSRRIAAVVGSPEEKLAQGFRWILVRAPKADEMKPLLALYTKSLERFSRDANQALTVATVPLGALAPEANAAEFAAWTVVGNVLLNLDEFLMKP